MSIYLDMHVQGVNNSHLMITENYTKSQIKRLDGLEANAFVFSNIIHQETSNTLRSYCDYHKSVLLYCVNKPLAYTDR